MRVTSAIKLRENLELERNISRALKIPLQLDEDERSMCDFANVHLVLCNSCVAVFVGDGGGMVWMMVWEWVTNFIVRTRCVIEVSQLVGIFMQMNSKTNCHCQHSSNSTCDIA